MEAQEILSTILGRRKAYRYFLLSLFDVKTKEEFQKLKDELLSDMKDDYKFIFSKDIPQLPVMLKATDDLHKLMKEVLEMFQTYKVLNYD